MEPAPVNITPVNTAPETIDQITESTRGFTNSFTEPEKVEETKSFFSEVTESEPALEVPSFNEEPRIEGASSNAVESTPTIEDDNVSEAIKLANELKKDIDVDMEDDLDVPALLRNGMKDLNL